MKRARALCFRILHPGTVCTLLLTLLSAAALVYVFANHLEDAPVANAVYAVAAYTLVLLVLQLPGVVRRGKAFVYSNKYSHRFVTDMPFRTRASLHASLFVNLAYAAFQLAVAIVHASFWYGAVAVYYMVIAAITFLLLRFFCKDGLQPKQELKAYRFCGLLLFGLNVAAAGIVVQMVRDDHGARYPGTLIYAMAAYTFYRVTLSIINTVKARKLESPVVSASRALNLATALMSLFTLQAAMLAAFGEDDGFKRFITPVTGGAVCVFIICMAVFMIARANRALARLQTDDAQVE